jgi:hypothetical protein
MTQKAKRSSRFRKQGDLQSSTLGRERMWKKLKRLLSEIQTEELLWAVWEIRKLQTEPQWQLTFFRDVPKEWRGAVIAEQAYFYPWRLETLSNLALSVSTGPMFYRGRQLNLRYHTAFLLLWSLMHKFENHAEGKVLHYTRACRQLGDSQIS